MAPSTRKGLPLSSRRGVNNHAHHWICTSGIGKKFKKSTAYPEQYFKVGDREEPPQGTIK